MYLQKSPATQACITCKILKKYSTTNHREATRNIQRYTEIYRDTCIQSTYRATESIIKSKQRYTEVYKNILKYTRICQSIQKYTEIYKDILKYTKIY